MRFATVVGLVFALACTVDAAKKRKGPVIKKEKTDTKPVVRTPRIKQEVTRRSARIAELHRAGKTVCYSLVRRRKTVKRSPDSSSDTSVLVSVHEEEEPRDIVSLHEDESSESGPSQQSRTEGHEVDVQQNGVEKNATQQSSSNAGAVNSPAATSGQSASNMYVSSSGSSLRSESIHDRADREVAANVQPFKMDLTNVKLDSETESDSESSHLTESSSGSGSSTETEDGAQLGMQSVKQSSDSEASESADKRQPANSQSSSARAATGQSSQDGRSRYNLRSFASTQSSKSPSKSANSPSKAIKSASSQSSKSASSRSASRQPSKTPSEQSNADDADNNAPERQEQIVPINNNVLAHLNVVMITQALADMPAGLRNGISTTLRGLRAELGTTRGAVVVGSVALLIATLIAYYCGLSIDNLYR